LTPPKNEDEIIKPAVEGTLAVMRAAHRNKVQRVVITSSMVAIMVKLLENHKDLYTEDDWSDVPACGAYEKSKTLAE
jgi:nucleoside-diphosphate-sugar epimerase